MSAFVLKKFDLRKYEEILGRGLCSGVGDQGEQVCIEAAICETLGLPHGDDPKCVTSSVRAFKIALNDLDWKTEYTRSEGLHDLGLAQLGSKGVVDSREFMKRMFKKLVQVMLPEFMRCYYPNKFKDDVDLCEKNGDAKSIKRLYNNSQYQNDTVNNIACHLVGYRSKIDHGSFSGMARDFIEGLQVNHHRISGYGTTGCDKYLEMAADLALDVLKELKSPGVKLLKKQ
jgi:hypothetical protein